MKPFFARFVNDANAGIKEYMGYVSDIAMLMRHDHPVTPTDGQGPATWPPVSTPDGPDRRR